MSTLGGKAVGFVLISALGSLFSVLVAPSFGLAGQALAQQVQVTICHATASSSNPYVQLTVNANAVDGNGNGSSDHNRDDHQNGEDIIPPGSWDADGRNWDAAGQAIWNNDCEVPTPSITPTPSPTPSVTPTPTPSSTPSVSPSTTPTSTPIPSTVAQGGIRSMCRVALTNRGTVNNVASAWGSTGGNTSNGNTQGGSSLSGNVKINFSLNNRVNVVSPLPQCPKLRVQATQRNLHTGENSTNSNSL